MADATALAPRELKKKWAEARPRIIQFLAKAIEKGQRERDKWWVPVKDIIPTGVTPRKFATLFDASAMDPRA